MIELTAKEAKKILDRIHQEPFEITDAKIVVEDIEIPIIIENIGTDINYKKGDLDGKSKKLVKRSGY